MSTIYTFHRECPADLTPALGDRVMTGDISANASHPGARDITLAIIKDAARGVAATDLLGFYGATPVDQGTFTATATTALTTNPTFQASTTASGFGFTVATTAQAYADRVMQMQADLDTLMAKINSTGFVDITGL